jgi:hypothetical protein
MSEFYSAGEGNEQSHGGMCACPQCKEPFLGPQMPNALVDIPDTDHYTIALECANCDYMALGTYNDEELEQLEEEIDNQKEQIRAGVAIMELTDRMEAIDRFAKALEDNQILPEDF